MFGSPSYAKLNVTAFGIASGCIAALSVIFFSILGATTGYGIELESLFEALNPGYTLTLPGVIVGAIWEFGIGYVAGSLFVIIYNKFAVPKK
jgi:hypothetical protein